MLPDPPGEVLKCPQRRQWAAADFLRAKTERPCIVVTRKGLCPTGSVGEKIKLGSSSLMLNVGFTPLHGDPVAIPRSFLLAPVFFRVKLSQHGAMFRSHSAPGPVIWDPRVRETFSHHSPVT